jgi:hypothetical protein
MASWSGCLLSTPVSLFATASRLRFVSFIGFPDTLDDRKRVKGIEPSSLAWKAMALPLSYTRTWCTATAFESTELTSDSPACFGQSLGARPGCHIHRGASGSTRRNAVLLKIPSCLKIKQCPATCATRKPPIVELSCMGGTGFEPVKAVPSDLQSDPFDRSGNPPVESRPVPLF